MKNTLENKSKFFAQHWMQHYTFIQGSSFTINERAFPLDNDCFIILKSLKIISIDELIFLQKDKYESYQGKEIKLLDIIYGKENRIVIEVKISKEKAAVTYGFELRPDHIDYLRSKGYALPYMRLSIEKQIEYGWIKISQL